MQDYQLQIKTVKVPDSQFIHAIGSRINYLWIESGPGLEKFCLAHNGFRLNSSYAQLLLPVPVAIVDENYYTHDAEVNKYSLRKSVFGFKNEADIQDAIRDAFGYQNEKIKKHCDWNQQRHESDDNHSWEFWMMASLLFYLDEDLSYDCITELPPSLRAKIKEALEIIEKERPVDNCVKSNIRAGHYMLEAYPEIIIYKIEPYGN